MQSDIFHHLISETVHFNASNRLCEFLTMKKDTAILKGSCWNTQQDPNIKYLIPFLFMIRLPWCNLSHGIISMPIAFNVKSTPAYRFHGTFILFLHHYHFRAFLRPFIWNSSCNIIVSYLKIQSIKAFPNEPQSFSNHLTFSSYRWKESAKCQAEQTPYYCNQPPNPGAEKQKSRVWKYHLEISRKWERYNKKGTKTDHEWITTIRQFMVCHKCYICS